MTRVGYVLVGGRSSRMGRDKALLPYRGGVLAKAVAGEVEAAAGRAVLVGSLSACGNLGFGIVPDIFPGEGPLGGILTALQNTTADWNLIVACDMPNVSSGFLRDLFQAAEQVDADILMPAGPTGRMEPLCAVYHRRARQPIYTAFASGIRKVTAAFDGLHTVILPVATATPLQNVNTPEEWDAHVRN